MYSTAVDVEGLRIVLQSTLMAMYSNNFYTTGKYQGPKKS